MSKLVPETVKLAKVHLKLGLHGFALLSKKYHGARVKHLVECSRGHRIRICPSDIVRGVECRECLHARQRLTVQDMNKLAQKKRGFFLSSEYRRSSIKYLWGCESGHTWLAKPSNIMMGTWCPECYRLSRANPNSWRQKALRNRKRRRSNR